MNKLQWISSLGRALMMPGLDGMKITRIVRRQCPDTRVLILSIHFNESYVLEALRAWAIGYVPKGSDTSDLIDAIRQAASGRRCLSPPLTERAIETYIRRAETMSFALDTITNREREVLHLASEGHSNVQVGARLGISPRTVETHKANLKKLRLNTQAELIRYCVQQGIYPMKDSSHSVAPYSGPSLPVFRRTCA